MAFFLTKRSPEKPVFAPFQAEKRTKIVYFRPRLYVSVFFFLIVL